MAMSRRKEYEYTLSQLQEAHHNIDPLDFPMLLREFGQSKLLQLSKSYKIGCLKILEFALSIGCVPEPITELSFDFPAEFSL